MASPKRWAWKNMRDVKHQYQYTFTINFLLGAALTWPFAIWVGRRAQRYQGGVPVVPLNRYVHDFVNVDPGHYSRKMFRWYHFGACIAGGLAFAYWSMDQNHRIDPWYQRPDFKPFPAMVPKESMDITERTAYETHYQSFRNKQWAETKKTRTWYRLFFPNDADYSVKENPYSQTHRENIYNPNNNFYANHTNHFRHHHNQ